MDEQILEESAVQHNIIRAITWLLIVSGTYWLLAGLFLGIVSVAGGVLGDILNSLLSLLLGISMISVGAGLRFRKKWAFVVYIIGLVLLIISNIPGITLEKISTVSIAMLVTYLAILVYLIIIKNSYFE